MTREERREYLRQWHKAHPEKNREYKARYYAEHRDKHIANQRHGQSVIPIRSARFRADGDVKIGNEYVKY